MPVLAPASSVADASERVAAPCLIAAGAGSPPGDPAPPVRELSLAELSDGPWCGGSLPFDVDLFRVRRVRIAMRLRVADDAWRARGSLAPAPPSGPPRTGAVPDTTVRFDVAPRGLATW